jgi:hypothetical protein
VRTFKKKRKRKKRRKNANEQTKTTEIKLVVKPAEVILNNTLDSDVTVVCPTLTEIDNMTDFETLISETDCSPFNMKPKPKRKKTK